MTYQPEEWCIVKITGTAPHYRVFGGWRGGYLTGDSWRLNSGIVSVEETDTDWVFIGHTGSMYICHKNLYGIRSPYNTSVLNDYVSKSGGYMHVIDEMPDIKNFKWNCDD